MCIFSALGYSETSNKFHLFGIICYCPWLKELSALAYRLNVSSRGNTFLPIFATGMHKNGQTSVTYMAKRRLHSIMNITQNTACYFACSNFTHRVHVWSLLSLDIMGIKTTHNIVLRWIINKLTLNGKGHEDWNIFLGLFPEKMRYGNWATNNK